MRKYTIEDLLKIKKDLVHYCNKFYTIKGVRLYDKVEDLLSDITYKFLTTDSIRDKIYENDFHFLSVMKLLCKYTYLQQKRKKTLLISAQDLDYHLDMGEVDVEYQQNIFGSFEENRDIYMMIRYLTYFEKKMLYELSRGYTKQELKEQYKLRSTYFSELFRKFNGEVFKKQVLNDTPVKYTRPAIKSTSYDHFKDNVLPKISNKDHRLMYSMYLDKVSLDHISRYFKTSKSSVGVTINRINKKLYDEYGYKISRRGEGSKSRTKT